MFGTQTLCVQSISVSGGDYTTGGACTVETTTTTTTTTTTAAPCNEWKAETSGNAGDGGGGTYVDCNGTTQSWGVDNSAAVYFCALGTPVQTSGTGVNLSMLGLCAPTTTTTTTTTIGPGSLDWNCVDGVCTNVGAGLGIYIDEMECTTYCFGVEP
jgi:hypothetical protein